MTPSGFMIAAPSSGAGKTTVTLAILRALARKSPVSAAKSGPDYIDPKFHEAACGTACVNLDAWAMGPDRLRALAHRSEPLIVEAAMGLFDGAPPHGRGSAADLSKTLRLPVVLVVDCGKVAQSVAAIVQGFAAFDPGVEIAGVILNRVGSDRHSSLLTSALEAKHAPPVLGVVARSPILDQPSRHLGLVQAAERSDLDQWLDAAADLISSCVDLSRLPFAPLQTSPARPRFAPPAQRIAVAMDPGFAFSYPHMLSDWRTAGAQILPFSPLADETVPQAEFVFLPGGYPELHAGQLAASARFLDSLRSRAATAQVYGECGGYMTLGRGLIDAQGHRHEMAGLLELETSFAAPKLHLGYRHLEATPGPLRGHFRGHEFHYATTLSARGDPLFRAKDAEGTSLGDIGLRTGRVFGSFAHIIDPAPETAASVSLRPRAESPTNTP